MKTAAPALRRLRTALQLSGQEEEAAVAIEVLFSALFDLFPLSERLVLDRLTTWLAQATEELGPEATPRQIVDRAFDIGGRPN